MIAEEQPKIKEWFNSEYYHILYDYRDEKEAKIFVESLHQWYDFSASNFAVDLGCGYGRLSTQLASKGMFVTGLDLSDLNINYARQYEHNKLEFYIHDIRLPWTSNQYHFAFSFFTSLGFWNDEKDYVKTFNNVYLSLKKGGVLIVDFINTLKYESNKEKLEQYTKEDVTFEIKKRQDKFHFYKDILVMDKPSGFTQKYTERVRKFTLKDFMKFSKQVGFEFQRVYGDYYLNDYDEKKSSRMIAIFKKP